jgi:hypothetical protein
MPDTCLILYILGNTTPKNSKSRKIKSFCVVQNRYNNNFYMFLNDDLLSARLAVFVFCMYIK